MIVYKSIKGQYLLSSCPIMTRLMAAFQDKILSDVSSSLSLGSAPIDVWAKNYPITLNLIIILLFCYEKRYNYSSYAKLM